MCLSVQMIQNLNCALRLQQTESEHLETATAQCCLIWQYH